MKKLLLPVLLSSVIMAVIISPVKAQDINNNPGAYMNAFTDAQTQMNKSYMVYISAAAHSSRKRKIERLREQAIESIAECKNTVNYLPAYKGDNSLRQGCINYVQLCYKVFNDDYAHIVNMEDIAEQSYDEMQAYLLLQQATNDTLQAAIKRINITEMAFAAKYNVTVINQKTELGDKLEESNRLGDYRNKVYLLFYKCSWEDNRLTENVNQKNVTKIEQVRSALGKYAREGLAVIDTLHEYANDVSLKDACKEALEFYKKEAETDVPQITDFYLKQENFAKVKAAMDAKSDSQKTQQDVDSYNKTITDLNAGVNAFNQLNDEINKGRNNVYRTWNDTEKAFLDAHTPYYK